jgi:hypothetical protein
MSPFEFASDRYRFSVSVTDHPALAAKRRLQVAE